MTVAGVRVLCHPGNAELARVTAALAGQGAVLLQAGSADELSDLACTEFFDLLLLDMDAEPYAPLRLARLVKQVRPWTPILGLARTPALRDQVCPAAEADAASTILPMGSDIARINAAISAMLACRSGGNGQP